MDAWPSRSSTASASTCGRTARAAGRPSAQGPASLVCAEHHRELAWGHGARPEVTGEFARRAREELRVRVAPELAARSAARTEARRERAAAGAPLGQLRDWLLDREGARCPPHRAYVSRWSDSASLCDTGSPV